MSLKISSVVQRLRKQRQTILNFIEAEKQKQGCNLIGLDDVINNKNRLQNRHIFGLLLFTFCTCMLSYQAYDRIEHYLSSPIAVDVITESDDVILPTLKICGSNTKEMAKLWNMTYTKIGEDVGFLDTAERNCVNMFKHLIANPNYDMDELWKATNMTNEVIDIDVKRFPNGTITQTESGSLLGICSAFKFDKMSSSALIGKSLSVTVQKFYHYICPATMFYLHLSEPSFDYFGTHISSTAKSTGSSVRIDLSINKFLFLNSSKNPCSNEKEHNDCYRNCLFQLLKNNLTCKFPFINVEMDLPPCNCSAHTHEQYGTAYEIISTTDAITDCSCWRPCEQIIYSPYMYVEEENEKSTMIAKLAITHDKIGIFKERYIYDIIALLDDLGGNFGLFLGLSLLSLIQTVYFSHYNWSNHRKNNVNSDKLRSLYDECKKIVTANSDKMLCMKILPRLKLVLVTICAGCALFCLLMCFNYYLEEPVINVIVVEPRSYSRFPAVTVCGEISKNKLRIERLRIRTQTGENCDNISPWRLFSSRLSLDSIWSALNIGDRSNIEDDLSKNLRGKKATLNITKKLFPLPFGNCSHFQAEINENLNAFLLVPFEYLVPPRDCIPNLWHFLSDPEGEIDFLAPRSIHYGTINIIILRMIKIERRHSKRRPCEINSSKYLKCKRNCLQNNLFRNVNCSLPYTSPLINLTLCNTTEDVINSHLTYLKNFQSNRKECKCNQPCTSLIYLSTLSPQSAPVKFYTVIEHKFADNFIHIIIEKQKYPVNEFLSDVGSIIGLALGISLLSLYDVLVKFYVYLKNNVNCRLGNETEQ